jgi:transposase
MNPREGLHERFRRREERREQYLRVLDELLIEDCQDAIADAECMAEMALATGSDRVRAQSLRFVEQFKADLAGMQARAAARFSDPRVPEQRGPDAREVA